MAVVLESLLGLSLVLASISEPAPSPVDAAADLRLPILLSRSVADDSGGDLTGVVRWQQTEEVPPDIPEDDPETLDQPIEDVETEDPETLDAPVEEAEPLDAELGKGEPLEPVATEVEPLDAEVVVAEVEPLDAPLAGQAPEPVARAPEPAPAAPAPATTTKVAPPVDSKRVLSLPPDFGRGQTIVRNPPAGVTAEVPTDCERVIEHGRAVIGLNCGDDDGPFWLTEMGHTLPVPQTHATSVRTEPVVTQPPLEERAVIVAPPPADGDDPGDGEVIGHSTVTVGQETVRVPNVRNVERVTIDRSGGRSFEDESGGDGNRAVARSRGGRVTGLNQHTSAHEAGERDAKQPRAKRNRAERNRAKHGKAKRDRARHGNGKRNPCDEAKRMAKSDVSKQKLAKHRATCKQYRKARADRRDDRAEERRWPWHDDQRWPWLDDGRPRRP